MALVAVTVSFITKKVYAYAGETVSIEKLVPAETQVVEMIGAGEAALMTPTHEKLIGIAGLCPAEAAEIERGGAVPAMFEKGDVAGRIEWLAPCK